MVKVARRPMLLSGAWVLEDDRVTTEVENPATEEVVARVATATAGDVAKAAAGARRAQEQWARRPQQERALILFRLAEVLERRAEELASQVVAETGKPITEARGEVGGAAGFCRFFAGLAGVFGGEVLPSGGIDQELWIRREPIGVVGAILPWNFPLALSARKAAPALLAGNAIVIKPAEVTPLSALSFAECAEEAGLPPGLMSVLPGPGRVVGAEMVVSPDIGLITMTGSVPAGRAILRAAAETVKPVSLELGGKAPFIVFEDADLDAAVESAVAMRMMNNGQTCVCNERTYVQQGVYDEFVRRYVAAVESLRVGDPRDDATQVGPKVSRDELENVERLVSEAVAEGAVVVSGGQRLSGAGYERGYWYAPTVVTDLPERSILLTEEVFGPVTPIVPFADEAEALALANQTDYGLSAYLYTSDFSRVMRMTKGIESGEVFVNRGGPEEVNGFHAGWGLSGLGGDDGLRGLEIYTRTKAVYVDWNDHGER